jgi:hypothetical protein
MLVLLLHVYSPKLMLMTTLTNFGLAQTLPLERHCAMVVAVQKSRFSGYR